MGSQMGWRRTAPTRAGRSSRSPACSASSTRRSPGNATTGDGAGITVYQPLSNESTTLDLANTIIAGNTGRDQCFVLRSVVTTGSNNLVTPHVDDTRTPCPGIAVTGDPQLGALALNAPGRTPTMALAPTGPAVDAGDPIRAPLDDQRGVARPQGAGPDIGAYELQGVTPPSDTAAPRGADRVAAGQRQRLEPGRRHGDLALGGRTGWIRQVTRSLRGDLVLDRRRPGAAGVGDLS